MTRLEFRDYVVDSEFKREDKDSQIYQALDDTLYDLSNEDSFQILQERWFISLVANQYDYTFPTDFNIFMGEVKYFSANGDAWLLNKLTKQQFDEKYDDLEASNFNKGEPTDFCPFGDQILIAPYLETVTTEKIQIRGSKVSTKLTADSDTPFFQDRFRETIKFGMLWRLETDLENISQASNYVELFQRGVLQMQRIDKSKSSATPMVAYQR